MLLSFFETGLAKGFYIYIKVLGLVIITVGVFLIYKRIQIELFQIKQLMGK